jgi:MFS family permease
MEIGIELALQIAHIVYWGSDSQTSSQQIPIVNDKPDQDEPAQAGVAPELAAPSTAGAFPPGLHNAFLFSTFNALSFQIILGSPMILYAKSLGASATVLGLIAGMMPLLVIFQIPAASYIPRMGFRRFVYAGWGTRVLVIFAMALVPLSVPFLEPQNRLGLMLGLLFAFNLSRGISSCAWLPWITALVPSNLRGKYLAVDAAVQAIASCVAFLFAALLLSKGDPTPARFALLFAFSGVAGAISLSFLKRIPDVEIPDEMKTLSRTSIPWLAMANHEPFRKLLYMVIGWSVASGGLTAFTVAFLKTGGMPEGNILLVNALAFIGGLGGLALLGLHLDRVGSKPVLTVSFFGWTAVLFGWVLLAGRVLEVRLSNVMPLLVLIGMLTAFVQMSNTRLAMAIVPVMGRNHFFAIYSVVGNVVLGLAPICWGLAIDAWGRRAPVHFGVEWNKYALFFALAGIFFLVTLVLARRLKEPEAMSMDKLLKAILVDTPVRLWSRLWTRE